MKESIHPFFTTRLLGYAFSLGDSKRKHKLCHRISIIWRRKKMKCTIYWLFDVKLIHKKDQYLVCLFVCKQRKKIVSISEFCYEIKVFHCVHVPAHKKQREYSISEKQWTFSKCNRPFIYSMRSSWYTICSRERAKKVTSENNNCDYEFSKWVVVW